MIPIDLRVIIIVAQKKKRVIIIGNLSTPYTTLVSFKKKRCKLFCNR